MEILKHCGLGLELLFCDCPSRLKKVIETMLIMQIKLKCVVPSCFIVNSTKNCKNILPALGNYYLIE